MNIELNIKLEYEIEVVPFAEVVIAVQIVPETQVSPRGPGHLLHFQPRRAWWRRGVLEIVVASNVIHVRVVEEGRRVGLGEQCQKEGGEEGGQSSRRWR
jgi:hypothetical protein